MPRLTVLVSSRIALTTALPYLKCLQANEVHCHVVMPSEIISLARERLGDACLHWQDLAALKRRHRIRGLVHRLLLLLMTPSNFSPAWPRYRDHYAQQRGRLVQWVSALCARIPGRNPRAVNRRIHAIMARVFRNPFATDTVLTFTVLGNEYLLSARRLRVVAVMESWDQTSKYPLGYQPACAFVWNRFLQEDWLRHQGAASLGIGYPIKLGYACAANLVARAGRSSDAVVRIMYPATFCANSLIHYFEEECRLIRLLAEATHRMSAVLFIKPKPNAVEGEYTRILEGFDNIEYGSYNQQRSAADYLLEDDYNRRRIAELRGCDLVINLGTTFAIDAALAGLPVLQLHVDDSRSFPSLTELMKNTFHLQEHFLSRPDLVVKVAASGVAEALAAGLSEEGVQRAHAFARSLRERFGPETTEEEAVARICKHSLGEIEGAS